MTSVQLCAACRRRRIVHNGAFATHTDMARGDRCSGSGLSYQEAISLERERLRNERIDAELDRESPTLVGILSPSCRRAPGDAA